MDSQTTRILLCIFVCNHALRGNEMIKSAMITETFRNVFKIRDLKNALGWKRYSTLFCGRL